MRFLIADCGSIGRRHLNNLRKLLSDEIIAYDNEPGHWEKTEKDYGVRIVTLPIFPLCPRRAMRILRI